MCVGVLAPAAPRNVSVLKVAQGWVVSWLPPLHHGSALKTGDAAANQNLNQQLDSSAIMQQQQQEPNQKQVNSSSSSSSNGSSQLFLQSIIKADVDFYVVELREKGGAWRQMAPVKETSYLVKNLKPGTEYFIRVVASSILGSGQPSEPIEFQLPDNRKKPGGAQALSAGIMGGVLFFIAAIVISVCTVKMCNNRRTKRGKKGTTTTITTNTCLFFSLSLFYCAIDCDS